MQTRLKDSLLPGHRYYIEFFANLPSTLRYACNNIGLLFTKKAIYVDTAKTAFGMLPATPQILGYGNPVVTDTFGWQKISGVYLAKGGEKFITLGNFFKDNSTTYKNVNPLGYNKVGYIIDDVSVIPLDSFNLKADAGKDTTIKIGDSVFIGSLTNGIDSLQWLQNGILKIDSTRPGFWVHPLVSTCYVLTQTVNGFTSSDTVCVTVGTVPLKFISYNVISRNEKSVENIWQTANEINVSYFNIQRSINGKDFINIGQVKAQNKSSNEYSFIDGGSAPSPLGEGWGEAFYRIESVDLDGRKQYSQTLNLKPQTLNNISVYPNPAKEQITVSCKGAKELMIIDYLGRVVYQLNNITVHQTINTKQFTKGLYLLQVKTINNEVYNEKLLVE